MERKGLVSFGSRWGESAPGFRDRVTREDPGRGVVRRGLVALLPSSRGERRSDPQGVRHHGRQCGPERGPLHRGWLPILRRPGRGRPACSQGGRRPSGGQGPGCNPREGQRAPQRRRRGAPQGGIVWSRSSPRSGVLSYRVGSDPEAWDPFGASAVAMPWLHWTGGATPPGPGRQGAEPGVAPVHAAAVHSGRHGKGMGRRHVA
jgi:hypothetical protein